MFIRILVHGLCTGDGKSRPKHMYRGDKNDVMRWRSRRARPGVHSFSTREMGSRKKLATRGNRGEFPFYGYPQQILRFVDKQTGSGSLDFLDTVQRPFAKWACRGCYEACVRIHWHLTSAIVSAEGFKLSIAMPCVLMWSVGMYQASS